MKTHNEILEILNKQENLTHEEEKSIFEYYHHTKNADVRSKMILKNQQLIHLIANRFLVTGVEYEDLEQEGFAGLCKAFDLFDYKLGFKFSTYAYQWIMSFISRYVCNYSRMIRIPVNMYESIHRLELVKRSYFEKYGQYPTDEYLSNETNISISQIKELEVMDRLATVMSLNMTLTNEDGSADWEDTVEDTKQAQCFEDCIVKVDSEGFWDVIKAELTPREFEILGYRMGYLSDTPMTLQCIGEKFGVTRERVRQIETKALRKLRHPRLKNQLLRFHDRPQ